MTHFHYDMSKSHHNQLSTWSAVWRSDQYNRLPIYLGSIKFPYFFLIWGISFKSHWLLPDLKNWTSLYRFPWFWMGRNPAYPCHFKKTYISKLVYKKNHQKNHSLLFKHYFYPYGRIYMLYIEMILSSLLSYIIPII